MKWFRYKRVGLWEHVNVIYNVIDLDATQNSDTKISAIDGKLD